jgi:UDP-N-acetylmuramyl pentapeptide phosphotransferase/UDP-N-acetylglucosamine-1-phosphate transferase
MIWWKYILVFFILVLSELVYFRLADKFNIIDKPNQRSSHTRITLRGGGVIFVFGMLLFFFFSGFEYYWFMIGLVAISAVAFIDDVHSVPNWLRLVVQFLAMGAMFHQMGLILEYPLWYIAVALILFVGIINAYNFMDGINGITGGYSLAVLLPLLYLDYSTTSPFIERSYLIIAIISVVIFNFFNFRTKAKCFAGDVGSVSIAFIILFALGMLILATGDVTYIVFLAVYGVDSVLTICHRILLREPLGKAHRKHLYQIMANELRIPHVYVSLVYMFVQLLISTGFVLLPVDHWLYLGITLGVLAVVYLLFMKKYYHLHREYLKSQKQ